ncbi:MAG: TRAP transporter permease [Rhodospirillales bacterium]
MASQEGEKPTPILSIGADSEPPQGYERKITRPLLAQGLTLVCAFYAVWHLWVLNVAPMETMAYRIVHVAGALAIGFALALPRMGKGAPQGRLSPALSRSLGLAGGLLVAWPLAAVGFAFLQFWTAGIAQPEPWLFAVFGPPLVAGVILAMLSGIFVPRETGGIPLADWVLIAAAIAASGFILFSLDNLNLRLRAGTAFADPQNGWAALAAVLLILELTRRVAGLALVAIAGLFVLYAFVGPWLPGFLNHSGYAAWRFFTYIYTDNGILGPTTAVSSTYIILFIIFAAFLQASKVGDYFVNFAFAVAGRARGGPAKVAVFASGLMGMINGTSAGNVVATGSLTIPLMKKVGYPSRSAGAIEAAASTGGQIMPPIMGAGAFIMAEITGIPYTEIAFAAVIPAILYFASIYFMVDFEAAKRGMRGLRQEELPPWRAMVTQVYLFVPIIILIVALFMGYSVIRAGTLATAAAAVASWLSPHKMGPRAFLRAFDLASRMAIQIIAVCACAGIIVGVISLTGVGSRFSALLLDLAAANQLIALFFAMLVSILLGMGMPTTAAYAVAASVVAPGLIQLGIEPLVAHFFVFYFAVVSAITPPVALASYAAAGISRANPLETSVASFKIGLAAFIVPFMFFYNTALLMEGSWDAILRALLTALVGVYLLSAAVKGWFVAKDIAALPRIGLLVAALFMIEGGLMSDLIGAAIALGVVLLVRVAGIGVGESLVSRHEE